MPLKLSMQLSEPTQAIQAAAEQITQVASNHLAFFVSCCSLLVSLLSLYLALKNNWMSNRDAGKKALVQFYEYSKQAYDLALANIYHEQLDKEKYLHLLGAEVFAELEKAGRTQQVKDAIDDLLAHFNVLLAATTEGDKSKIPSPDELLKVLYYIKQKSLWLVEEYTFRVYFWNLASLFR